MDINKTLMSSDDITILGLLKTKKVKVPDWSDLVKAYEGKNHNVNNRIYRPDKVLDGKIEPVARIYLELEKLIVARMVEFMFAIPVKRIYSGLEDHPEQQAIYKAIESIYKRNRIDSQNIERARALFASCEICTLWYTVEQKNNYYGFTSEQKLRTKTYSPMDGFEFYPLFDEYDDMVAMSISYQQKDANGVSTTIFETYTDQRHVVWNDGIRVKDEENPLGKIPFVYSCRKEPVYEIVKHIRDEIEFTLSRNSDVIAYNSAPILQVSGEIISVGDDDCNPQSNPESKDKSKKIFRVEHGGSVSYVSWNQAIDSIKFQVDMLLRLLWMQVQLPDLSFENLKGLGAISGEARKTLLTDAHLKVGDEKGAFLESFDRECNIIKSFLAKMNPRWATALDMVEVEHVITPFIQNDEMNEIEKWIKATGGKPIMSQVSAIQQLGLTDNAQGEYEAIIKEENEQNQRQVIDIFQGGE